MQDRQEPSMEDILASIKKVIADEKGLRAAGVPAVPVRSVTSIREEAPREEVLELDEPVIEQMKLPEAELGAPLVSDDAAEASRRKLAALQQVAAAAPPPPQENALEAIIRDMLRPVLKDWLDQHLPAIVDEHVRREISRITGQKL
jgi:cell pole-organizing protein PopZ